MKQIVTLEERVFNPGASPAYAGFGLFSSWFTSRFLSRCVFGVDVTVRNFRLISSANAAAGTTITLTVMKSDVDTALTLTLTDASAIDLDTGATEVAFAVGDDIVIKGEFVGTHGSPNIWISVEFETADGSSVVLLPQSSTPLDGTARRHGALGGTIWTTNAASTVQDVIPTDGTITALCGLFGAASGGHQIELTLYLNGVAQDGTGGTVDTRMLTTPTGNFGKGVTSFSLPVVAGDLVHIEGIRTAGGTGCNTTTGIVFVADTPGESIIAGQSSGPPTSNDSFYHQFGDDDSTWDALVSALRQKGVSTSFSIRKFHVRKEVSPSPGTYAIAVAKNDVASALAVSVTAAGIVSDLVDSVNIADGDTFMLENVSSGSPTGGNLMWSAVQYIANAIAGSFVAGVNTTVTATRAAAFGLDGATNVHNETGVEKVFGNRSTSGYMELIESTAPTGVANKARLFVEDNGSGKTRLMVQFGTGVAIQLSIEL